MVDDDDKLSFPLDKELVKKTISKNVNARDNNYIGRYYLDENTRKKMRELLSTTSPTLVSEQDQEDFVLPTEFLDGTITASRLRIFARNKYLCHDEYDEENYDFDTGIDALNSAISFLFRCQDNKELKIEEGKRRYRGLGRCQECGQFAFGSESINCQVQLHTCSDCVYPLRRTWFDILYPQCEGCLFLHTMSSKTYAEILVSSLKYLSLGDANNSGGWLTSIYSMTAIADINFGKIDIHITSNITDWLPILFFDVCDDDAYTLFVNCNPRSKFYRWISFFEKDTWRRRGGSILTHLDDFTSLFY